MSSRATKRHEGWRRVWRCSDGRFANSRQIAYAKRAERREAQEDAEWARRVTANMGWQGSMDVAASLRKMAAKEPEKYPLRYSGA